MRWRALGAVALLTTLSGPYAARAQAEPGALPSVDPLDEVRFKREGFAIGIAAGPGLFFGRGEGLNEARGFGGNLSLRVGTTATPSLLWILQVDASAHEVKDMGGESSFAANPVLTLGGQLYVRESLWLRAGAGAASFLKREEDGTVIEETRRLGLGLVSAIGVEVFRRGMLAIHIEAMSSASAFAEGSLWHGTMQLGATWY